MNYIFEIPRFDRISWAAALKGSRPAVREAVELGTREIIFNFEALGYELHHALYREWPTPAHVHTEDEWRDAILTVLAEAPEYPELRSLTVGSAFYSATGAAEILAMVAQHLERPGVTLEDPGQLRDTWRGYSQQWQASRQPILDGDGNPAVDAAGDPVLDDGNQLFKTLAEQVAERGTNMAQAIAQWQPDRQALRELLYQAAALALAVVKQRKETNALFGGVNSDLSEECEPGGDLETKQDAARAIAGSAKLQQIIDLVGRLKPIAAQKQAEKSALAPATTIDGVKSGRDVRRSLPTEYGLMAKMPYLWAAKYADNSLMQWDMTGKDVRAKGPIVVLLDSTGSMAGQEEIWAKAVTWVLLLIAQSQDRDAMVVHWGTKVHQVDEYPAGRVNPQKMLGTMQAFFSARRNQEDVAFQKAVEIIERNPRYKNADIAFITDGCWGAGSTNPKSFDKWLKQFPLDQQRLGFQVYSVYINSRVNEAVPAFLHDTEKYPQNRYMVLETAMSEVADASEPLSDLFQI